MKIKPSQTFLNYRGVRKLGHLVSAHGRRIDPERVRAILEMAQPKTIEQLESFLGMFLYNQEYLKGNYVTLKPLYDLKSKRSTNEWTEVHTQAFDEAKKALSNIPILLNPDTTKEFHIVIDACTRGGRGLGAVLKQCDDEGILRPVAYWSHALTDQERQSYSASMAEARALHGSILFWGVYLRHGPTFKVYSDHRALIYMLTTSIRTANRVVMRYILDLQEYNFSLHYKKGTLNLEADAVSRLLRYDDESIFFPKTADELRDDKGPLLTKSEQYMAKQMMKDWLWLYPEVCWRDPLGRPLQPKEVTDGIKMDDEDLLPPVPRKQRGHPRKIPTVESVPEAAQMEQIRDIVSETMEVLVSNVELQHMPLHHMLPTDIVMGDEMMDELETCYVMMQRSKKQPTAKDIAEQRRRRKVRKHTRRKPVPAPAAAIEEDDDDIAPALRRPEFQETKARAVRVRTCLQNTPDVHPEAEKWKWLVGRVYEDFDNHRLYEVTYIYYDRKEQRACGYG